jgi:hypothetical protein
MHGTKINQFTIKLIKIVAIMAILVLIFWVQREKAFQKNHDGDLYRTSVSSSGRWKVRVFNINPGAGALTSVRADVVDLNNKVKTRNIFFDLGHNCTHEPELKWENSNVVILYGHEIDVQSGAYHPL